MLNIGHDWRSARIVLRKRWYNSNYVGVHFGGSLFAMADAFWMILVKECLGREYVVWDKAGEIEFVAPGRSDVFADFQLDDEILDELRAKTSDGEKVLHWFPIDIKTAQGDVIARVRKQVYVRRKPLREAN